MHRLEDRPQRRQGFKHRLDTPDPGCSPDTLEEIRISTGRSYYPDEIPSARMEPVIHNPVQPQLFPNQQLQEQHLHHDNENQQQQWAGKVEVEEENDDRQPTSSDAWSRQPRGQSPVRNDIQEHIERNNVQENYDFHDQVEQDRESLSPEPNHRAVQMPHPDSLPFLAETVFQLRNQVNAMQNTICSMQNTIYSMQNTMYTLMRMANFTGDERVNFAAPVNELRQSPIVDIPRAPSIHRSRSRSRSRSGSRSRSYKRHSDRRHKKHKSHKRSRKNSLTHN